MKIWLVILMCACAYVSGWNWIAANSTSGIDFENRGMFNAILAFVFAIATIAFFIAALVA